MPRKILDQNDALRCLDAARASGLDRKTWARRNNIDARSLNAWHVNLTRSGRQPLRLVELLPSGGPARYLLRLDGLELELDDYFRDDTLTRLLGVLSRC